MSKIKILNIQTLSYSGTTWLNLLLGSHPQAMAIGPPHRLWKSRESNFYDACLVHGKECKFWPKFFTEWDQNENFFVALSRFSGKTIFLMDNADQNFIDETMNHPDITHLKGRYVRDGRAITASYARKMKDSGVDYIQSIKPGNWFHASFQAIPPLEELYELGNLVIHYEDVVSNQEKFLSQVGSFLNVAYQSDALRFWEKDHHITCGNTGPIAMIRLEQELKVAQFESLDVYQEQLSRLRENPTVSFSDERWKVQLDREDLFWFDKIHGDKNEMLGYERDNFTPSEIETFTGVQQEKRGVLSTLISKLRKPTPPN